MAITIKYLRLRPVSVETAVNEVDVDRRCPHSYGRGLFDDPSAAAVSVKRGGSPGDDSLAIIAISIYRADQYVPLQLSLLFYRRSPWSRGGWTLASGR